MEDGGGVVTYSTTAESPIDDSISTSLSSRAYLNSLVHALEYGCD